MLADKFILDLERVELQNKELLPDYSGIYYVIDRQHLIWYIGRSINLQQRWNSIENPHHRYHQLLTIATQKNTEFFIHYYQEQKNKLNKLEQAHISKYQPCLNYTSVVKKNTGNNIKPNYCKNNININKSLKILSDHQKYPKTKTNNLLDLIDRSQNSNLELALFKRKFIYLNNKALNLNLELELCIDIYGRYFVRHYALDRFYNGRTFSVDETEHSIENCLLGLKSRCQRINEYSCKWLGYKISFENVVLLDEETGFEIKTRAIVLPFPMFVDLVEYDWITNNNLSEELLENKEIEWFQSDYSSIKIAKHLYDNDLTLYKLIEQLETD
jgi:hypothetical protein